MKGAPPSIEYMNLIPFLKDLPVHVANAIIVVVFLLVSGYLATKNIKKSNSLIPSDKFSLQNIGELIVEVFSKLLESQCGREGLRYVPLIGTLGVFILFSNLAGLIPGMLPPTDNLNTTAACALIVLFAIPIIGFKTHGVKYLKHFMGPFWWLAPLMVPLELISLFSKPISLSLRLFGNIMGDHLVLAIFIGLSPFLVPIPVLILGIFVSLLQTLIFVVLSTLYIAGAIAEAH